MVRFSAISITFLGTRGRTLKRLLGEYTGQLAPVFGAGLDIRLSLEARSSALGKGVHCLRRERLTAQYALLVRAQDRDRPDTGKRQPRVGAAVRRILLNDCGDTHEREVAVAPGELGKGITGSWSRRREAGLNEQLVRRQRRSEIRDEKLLRRDSASTTRALYPQLRAQGQGNGAELGCRVGVGKAPHDRAAVTNLEVADEWKRLGQQGTGFCHQRA